MTEKNPVYTVAVRNATFPVPTAAARAGGYHASDDPFNDGHRGEVVPRGFEIEITPELVRVTTNRLGKSWTEDLSDEAQLRYWGEIRLLPGPLSDHRDLEAEIRAEQEAEEEERIQQEIISTLRQPGGREKLKAALLAERAGTR